MYPAVRELSTTYHHVSLSCQINESHPIAIGVVMETVRADSAPKDAFLTHLSVEITNHNFDIMFGTVVVRFIQLVVKGVFGHLIGIFSGGMGTYQADIEKPSLYSDGAQSLVYWVPTNDVVPQFCTNYKTNSE